jgi:ABC-type cobalamin/Fe3+-siderophores transport system ATPase subunit
LTEALLRVIDLTFGFPQRRDFLKPVQIDVNRGERWGIIGPNGAGKSTLLRLLAGLLTPDGGRVLLGGHPIDAMSHRDRARLVSFTPQDLPRDLPTTARDIVLMGRYPHRGLGLFETAADHEIARHAMEVTRTAEFADRSLATLSGGEAQRVHLAAALAQQPAVLLLDEPTAALDLYHQIEIFSLLERLSSDQHVAIVIVTHDLNLAARYCTHVLLLNDGRTVSNGPPDQVIRPAVLEPVYGVELHESAIPGGRWLVPMRNHSKAGGR